MIYDKKLILHTCSNVAILATYLIESEMYTAARSPFITYSVNSRATIPHAFIGGQYLLRTCMLDALKMEAVGSSTYMTLECHNQNLNLSTHVETSNMD